MTWRNTRVPNSAIGKRIEHWHKADNATWFRVVGVLIELEGEPGMDPTKVEEMSFHQDPPVPTEGTQIWRELSPA